MISQHVSHTWTTVKARIHNIVVWKIGCPTVAVWLAIAHRWELGRTEKRIFVSPLCKEANFVEPLRLIYRIFKNWSEKLSLLPLVKHVCELIDISYRTRRFGVWKKIKPSQLISLTSHLFAHKKKQSGKEADNVAYLRPVLNQLLMGTALWDFLLNLNNELHLLPNDSELISFILTWLMVSS